MAGGEGVEHALQREGDAGHLPRREWPRPVVALAVAAAEDLRSHQALAVPGVVLPGLGIEARQAPRVLVDQLHHPVGVAGGGRDPELDLQLAGQRQRLGQRLGAVDQHVRPPRGEALVLGHVGGVPAGGDVGRVGNRLRGVRDEGVEAVAGRRRGLPRQRAAGGEEQPALLEARGRPGLEAPPGLGTGVEDHRLGELRWRPALEVVGEEGQQHLTAEVLRSREAEVGVAEAAAVAAQPGAVAPRAHHQRAFDAGVELLDGGVGVEGAVEVLGVVEPAHREHRAADAREVAQGAARGPELVVVGVGGELVPEGHLAVEVALVDVGERPELEEEAVAVRRAVVEARRPLADQALPRPPEAREKVEGEVEGEGAVVVHVVEVPVGDRRRRQRRADGWVGVDDADGGVEARVGVAPDADPAVVVRQVLDQPLDGVPGVGALVGAGGRIVADRSHVDELALRHKAAAHVFGDEDVALARELL